MRMQVTNIRVHPSFNQRTYESDIALLQLEKAATINDFVRPSCYPTTSNLHNELIHLSAGSSGEVSLKKNLTN